MEETQYAFTDFLPSLRPPELAHIHNGTPPFFNPSPEASSQNAYSDSVTMNSWVSSSPNSLHQWPLKASMCEGTHCEGFMGFCSSILEDGLFSQAQSVAMKPLKKMKCDGGKALSVQAVAPTVKKQRVLQASGGGGQVPRCQVEGCTADLSIAPKLYHRRHKVCEMHSKAPRVITKGMEQRFCQQCSRFHELSEFDEAKRSCRRRLAGHNERRRKSCHDTSSSTLVQERRPTFSALMQQPAPLTMAFLVEESHRRSISGDHSGHSVWQGLSLSPHNAGLSVDSGRALSLLSSVQQGVKKESEDGSLMGQLLVLQGHAELRNDVGSELQVTKNLDLMHHHLPSRSRNNHGGGGGEGAAFAEILHGSTCYEAFIFGQ